MENKKTKILRNIKRIESELRLEKLVEDDISKKIATYKALSMVRLLLKSDIWWLKMNNRKIKTNFDVHIKKLGEQIQTALWKISQADFIYCCEEKKQSNYLCHVKKSNVLVQKAEIPNQPERSLNDTVELIESLSARLEVLRRTNSEKRESISWIEKELDALKKRNDSVLRKLKNEFEELENEERQLEDILEQTQQTYYSEDNFYIC